MRPSFVSRRVSLLGLSGLLLAGGARPAASASASEGLLADYTDGQRRVTTIVPNANFSLNEDESIHPAIKPSFGAAWTGTLKILMAGKYKISAPPATVLVDDHPITGAPQELSAGVHRLRIEYRRPAGKARLQVMWESDAFGPEPIPAAVLQHEGASTVADRWASVDRGRALVDDLNCRGCHDPAKQSPASHGRGPLLSNVGARTTSTWIYRWLENPTAYRPGATMPNIALTEQERRDVATYLGTTVLRGYEEAGSITAKKEDAAVTPERQAKGKELYDRIGCLACHGTGPNPVSLAAIGSKMSALALRAYLLNPAKIEPTGRMPGMFLKDEEASLLGVYLSGNHNRALEVPVPAGDGKRGKDLVGARGCLGCHTLEVEGDLAKNALPAPAFATLKAGRGCLATAPTGLAPRYRLNDGQRADIAAFLETPDVAKAPIATFRRGVDFFRCRACHELGGPAAVTFKDVPPALNDTGNKLRVSWLRDVLGGRMRTRYWMDLRMPSFAGAADLSEGFAATVGASREDPPATPRPDAQHLRDGVRYLGRGEEGLACVNCHDFAWYRSGSATPAPDMATMGRRLRPEWFRRWMLDPQRIAPGTQMPMYFADVAMNVIDRKVGDLWSALSLGKDMPLPEGVTPDGKALKLPIGKDPVLFRSFVTGGANRSILVGFPGGGAYAFDADDCRLEFAWSGEFLDVRPVWNERGGGKAIPLGDRYYVAPEGLPLRIGDPGRPGKAQFKGYLLDKKVPVMMYEVDGASVRERITPVASGRGVQRAFEVKGGSGDLWFVPGAATGVEIEADGGQWDGEKRLRVPLHKGATTRFTITVTATAPKPK